MMILGEVSHMLQDTYSPVHVVRGDDLKIKQFQDIHKFPFLKHQIHDYYHKETHDLFFAAITATERLLNLFINNNSNMLITLNRLLEDIMSFDPNGVVWGGISEKYKK